MLLLCLCIIEAGVRFVTANAVSDPPRKSLASYQIWDTHFEHFRLYDGYLMHELDQGLAALISDLDERGLLAEDNRCSWMGEFGRTPKINGAAAAAITGRMPTPWLWAGGGVPAGQVIGSTDRQAAFVKDARSNRTICQPRSTKCSAFRTTRALEDIGGRPQRPAKARRSANCSADGKSIPSSWSVPPKMSGGFRLSSERATGSGSQSHGGR